MAYIEPPQYSIWNSGPPPDIGWWPCSVSRSGTLLRYWDGKYWSTPVHHSEGFCVVSAEVLTDSTGILLPACRSSLTANLKWAERWWEVK